MKTAFVFPGQGAQFPGMGKDLYESSVLARDMMEQANQVLGFRLTDIMFEGTEGELKATSVTQPAVFLHSVCAALCSEGVAQPDMVAGHSLGEFSALVVCGTLDFKDALELVLTRAREMQVCCGKAPGTMAAVIGLDESTVKDICSTVDGIVVPANYNSDSQIVISGEKDAVAEACNRMSAAGARRALPLNVSGAFHSPLMEPARTGLAKAIKKTEFKKPFCPIYQNANASPESDPSKIKDNLLKQLTSPVLWTQTVRAMRKDGAVDFKEFGPGNVLQGLIKRIK